MNPARTYFLFFFIYGFFSAILWAQKYPVTVIDYDDGLAKSSIYEVTKDPQGYMWLGADASVIRYDGKAFTYYSAREGVSGSFVLDIDFDPYQRMWVSTYGGGIACFDGAKFHAYNAANGFPANYVRGLIFTGNGELWAATEDQGVVRKKQGEMPRVLKRKDGTNFLNTWNLLESRKGDIWVGGIDGVIQFKKEENFEYTIRHYTGFTMTSLCEDKDGGIWAGGAYTLVKVYPDSVISYDHILPPGTIILDMHIGQEDGKVYLATVLGLMMVEGEKVTVLFNQSNGIRNHQFWDIYEDENHELWLSSGGGGVTKYDKRAITIYEGSNGVNFGSMISDIVETNDGRMIFGTELNGSFYKEKGEDIFKTFEQPSIQKIRSSYALAYHPGYDITLFTSTQGGIYWLRKDKVIYSYEPAPGQVKLVYGIEFIDSTKAIILSDDGSYTVTAGADHPERIEDIPKVFCRTVFRDKEGAYWILGDKGEIFQWKDSKTKNWTEILNPGHYILSAGLYDSYHDLYWFCSNAGLIIWNGENRMVLHAGNGLNADMIVAIAQDPRHKIWVGHDRGLTGIDVENKSFTYLGYDQGFISVIVNLRAVMASREGKLWAGSFHDLYKIDLEHLTPKNKHTKLHLQEINFRDQVYFHETYNHDSIPPLELSYKNNNLLIRLQALDYVNADGVKYSWMLKGYDHDFMPYTSLNEINYTNLRPGSYEFVAKAMDADGFPTNEVHVSIHIGKPFWETIWFYMLEVIIFGTIVFLSFAFSSRSSDNRLGQVMTFLTIIIIFESLIFYVSKFIDPYTNGIPVFQLVMNIVLASVLYPVEQFVKRQLKKAVKKAPEEEEGERG